jgi:streptogramin lyase
LWGAPDGVKSVPVATAAAGMPPSAASAASAASPPAVRYTPIAAANGHAEAARWERQDFPTHSGMPRRVHSEQLDAMLTSLLSKLEVRGELEPA